jgi:cytochrome c553
MAGTTLFHTTIAAAKALAADVSATPTRGIARSFGRRKTTTSIGAWAQNQRFTTAPQVSCLGSHLMNRAIISALALAGAVCASAASAQDGAKLYQPCKACHLASGKGVPGAFPPLGDQIAALASRPDGRAYLPLVIKRGMIGVLKVDGMSYRGAMPARPQYDGGEVASLLNYILTDIVGDAGAKVDPFTAQGVQASWDEHPKARGKAVLALRPDLSKPVPAADTPKVKESAVKTEPQTPAKSEAVKTAALLESFEDPTKERWAQHLKAIEKSAAGKPN